MCAHVGPVAARRSVCASRCWSSRAIQWGRAEWDRHAGSSQVMVEVMSNVFLKNSKSQSDVEVYLQVRLGRLTAERTVLDGTRVLQRY